MTSDSTGTKAIEWQARPLCLRYLVVLFKTSPVRVMENGCASRQPALWAVGVLANGQCEALRAWMTPMPRSDAWPDVFEDLSNGGVERIRFVTGNEVAEMSTDLCKAYPGARVLPSIGQLMRQSLAEMAPRYREAGAEVLGAIRAAATAHAACAALVDLASGSVGVAYPSVVDRWRTAVERLGPLYALGPRLRSVILAADETVQQLHRSLSFAINRQGCFADRAAATSFIVGALERAERGLAAQVTVQPACTKHRAGSVNRASSRLRVEAPGL